MPNETSKARNRREADPCYDFLKHGRGIDIGCGGDPINDRCLRWDLGMGDAQILEGVPSNYFDWVYSSHCLEHMLDARAALHRWWDTVVPGGHMFVIVPDENLYEQQHWPSVFNPDHKHTFTILEGESWSPVSINVNTLVSKLPKAYVIRVNLCDTGYTYNDDVWDRTAGDAEAQIELIAQKRS